MLKHREELVNTDFVVAIDPTTGLYYKKTTGFVLSRRDWFEHIIEQQGSFEAAWPMIEAEIKFCFDYFKLMTDNLQEAATNNVSPWMLETFEKYFPTAQFQQVKIVTIPIPGNDPWVAMSLALDKSGMWSRE